jgi:hypothetical protein
MALDYRGGRRHSGDMTPLSPMPKVGGVFPDKRDNNRWLRVSWHEDMRMFVISTWHRDQCVSAFQLDAADAPALLEMLGSIVPSESASSADAPAPPA